MFDNIENLKIISSLHKTSKPYSKIERRKTNTLIIRVDGSAVYNFYNKTLTVNQGEMIFLPKGTSYEYKVISPTPSSYTSVNFEGDFVNPVPAVYSLENFYEAEYMSSHFTDLWNLGTQAEKYTCISMFYSLLSYISNIENSRGPEKKKFEIIEPAVKYLKGHIYDCTLKIDKLHRLCGISDTYFRQIFSSKFGSTPRKYVMSKRLFRAKSIIESGDFNTIGEVAQSVGFADPLYFSKVFKKMYGSAPSDVGNM